MDLFKGFGYMVLIWTGVYVLILMLEWSGLSTMGAASIIVALAIIGVILIQRDILIKQRQNSVNKYKAYQDPYPTVDNLIRENESSQESDQTENKPQMTYRSKKYNRMLKLAKFMKQVKEFNQQEENKEQ